MIGLGTKAPGFKLYDAISEKEKSLSELKSNIATVIMFISNHCPFVQHLNPVLGPVIREYQAKGVAFIGIGSNDVNTYPEDGPEMMRKVSDHHGFTFPYLFDETQEVARDYQAVCTPDFFVFNKGLELSYRGRFDETRPGTGTPTGNDLKSALDSLIAGEEVTAKQFPSIGCSIKWKY